MTLIVKNAGSASFVCQGQTIVAGGSYTVPAGSEKAWATDSVFNQGVLQSDVIVNDGSNDYARFSALDYLESRILNLKIEQQDSDGATFVRIKQAPAGWTFLFRCLEVTTALGGSLINLDAYNAALSDATITFYDASGAVLTSDLSTCVKTVVDLEQLNDFYLIGGISKIAVQPTSDVRISVVGAPDIPYVAGGSRVFIQNINFRFIGANDSIVADGRASKLLSYNATYHTNKLRFSVFHPAGEQHNVAFGVQLYKV